MAIRARTAPPGDELPASDHGEPGSNWVLRYEAFDPDREGLREALCTLGNGYFATRGAAPEARADEVHYPGTYVAGCYNRLVTDVAGRTVENEDMVNLPELAAADVPDRRRRRGSTLRRLDVLELPAGPGPAPRGAHPRRAVPAMPPARVTRVTAAALRRTWRDRTWPRWRRRSWRENWSGPIEVRLGPRRDGDQHRGRSLPGSGVATIWSPSSRAIWAADADLAAGARPASRDIRIADGGPHSGHAGRHAAVSDSPSWSTSPGSSPTGSSLDVHHGSGSPSRRWSPSTPRATRDLRARRSRPRDGGRAGRRLRRAAGGHTRSPGTLLWRPARPAAGRSADAGRPAAAHLPRAPDPLAAHRGAGLSACPPGACTARRTAGTSSGTSCSCSRS